MAADEPPKSGKVLSIIPGDINESESPGPDLIEIPTRPARFANPDWMRGALALILTATFCLAALGSLLLLTFTTRIENVSRADALIFGALSGVTGAVSGFYFGGRDRR